MSIALKHLSTPLLPGLAASHYVGFKAQGLGIRVYSLGTKVLGINPGLWFRD